MRRFYHFFLLAAKFQVVWRLSWARYLERPFKKALDCPWEATLLYEGVIRAFVIRLLQLSFPIYLCRVTSSSCVPPFSKFCFWCGIWSKEKNTNSMSISAHEWLPKVLFASVEPAAKEQRTWDDAFIIRYSFSMLLRRRMGENYVHQNAKWTGAFKSAQFFP